MLAVLHFIFVRQQLPPLTSIIVVISVSQDRFLDILLLNYDLRIPSLCSSLCLFWIKGSSYFPPNVSTSLTTFSRIARPHFLLNLSEYLDRHISNYSGDVVPVKLRSCPWFGINIFGVPSPAEDRIGLSYLNSDELLIYSPAAKDSFLPPIAWSLRLFFSASCYKRKSCLALSLP